MICFQFLSCTIHALIYALSEVYWEGRIDLEKDSILHVCNGDDVFLWLPTGFGKFIIYECLPFVLDYRLNRVCSDSPCRFSPCLSYDGPSRVFKKERNRCCIMNEHCTISKDIICSERDIDKYHLLFCVPEAIIKVDRWRRLLTKSFIIYQNCRCR